MGSSSCSNRVSVRANPFTVASGVRRSWHASETSRANPESSVTSASVADTMGDVLHEDLQASTPDVRIGLSRAGVERIEKAIRFRHRGIERQIPAEIDCVVDLDPARKGVHMSRFPELFEEAIDEVVIGEALLVEALAEHIARQVVGRQGALRAEVRVR